MCPKIVNQKSYTEVQIRPSLYTFMQILSPSTIKLWPGHRLRRKNNINNKGSKISTGPLYYSIVGTVKTLEDYIIMRSKQYYSSFKWHSWKFWLLKYFWIYGMLFTSHRK